MNSLKGKLTEEEFDELIHGGYICSFDKAVLKKRAKERGYIKEDPVEDIVEKSKSEISEILDNGGTVSHMTLVNAYTAIECLEKRLKRIDKL